MNTPKSPDTRYIDLARAGANIKRPISAQTCERLGVVMQNLSDGHASLQFRLTEDGDVAVSGVATMQGEIDCHLCMVAQPVKLRADVTGVIVAAAEQSAAPEPPTSTERQIDWDAQPIVVSNGLLNINELVEDELLLNVPAQVCRDEDCPHRPDMFYGDAHDGIADGANGEADDHPFAQLRQLRDENRP